MNVYRKRVFPSLELWVWLWFLFLDLSGTGGSTPVKFAGICLCAATALLRANTADGRLVAAALCFTVAADWFLLVRNEDYLAGIGLFLIVQTLYALRLSRLGGTAFPVPLLPPLGGLLALATVVLPPPLLTAVAALVYFSILCRNAVAAFRLGQRVFAWGLVLFICCDLCVGAWNLSPPLLPQFTGWGSWLFYLPSQVLIVLSVQ